MKTTLKSLELKGLRSFVEPTSITFPESGLLLFMGPSGSGKSSIFMAIAHALGYSPYSGTELQSWLGDEKLEVKLGLGTNSGDAMITRGPKSFIEGADAVVGASNLTPAIHRITGLSTELLSALTYRPQGTAGLFLSKTNSEMQDFLSVLLGLNKFDEAVEKAQEKVKSLDLVSDIEADVVPRLKYALDRAMEKVAPGQHDEQEFVILASKAQEVFEAVRVARELTLTKNAYAAAEWKKQQLTFSKRIAEEQSKHPRPVDVEMTPEIEGLVKIKATAYERINKLQAKDKGRLQGIKNQIEEEHEKYRELTSYVERMDEWAREKLIRLAEIEKLETAVCPRCEQDWKTDKVAADLVKTKKRLAELNDYQESSIQAGKSAEVVKEKIRALTHTLVADPVLKQLEDVYNDAKAQSLQLMADLRAANLKAINDWTNKIKDAVAGIKEEEAQATRIAMTEQDARSKVLLAIEKEVADARLAWQNAENRVKTVKQENEYARKETERLVAEQSAAREEYEQAKTKLDLTQKALREEQDLLEMLKAFLTAIYDEVLEEIAYSTNQMLAQVPNVSHVTIKFKSETTTQKGSTKRAITPVVNLGGGERPLRSALSGGMMSAVELAVDLAVRKVISARSGAIPGWLVLDECFEGLGIADKESCLELLKQASQNTLILVIDHSSETKELFSQTIEVENNNGRSSIAGS
jgi:DNA repair exonuclease SbcCD ATPase subunit